MSLSSSGGNKLVTSKNYIGGIARTKVQRNLETRATFKAGELFPIYCEEIYPAMNKKVKQGSFIRSITPLGPVMDKSFLDVFYFFVPFRLIWDHWEEFIAGYNKEAWTQGVEYTTPQIKFKVENKATSGDYDYNVYIGSFLDHLPGACDVCSLARQVQYFSDIVYAAEGDSAKASAIEDGEKRLADTYSISALYPRAFAKIWNDWFRDENLQDELEIYTGDNDEYADEFCFNLLSESDLPKSAKYHNRFTSLLPQPQKGPDVLIPMNNLSVEGINTTGNTLNPSGANSVVIPAGSYPDGSKLPLISSFGVAGSVNVVANNVSNTIRMLRLATQTELLLARDARGGTRYVESLLSHWSTHNGDARLQRSEYLGSRQIPLSVVQVTNTAQGEGSPLGNVGGQSVTRDAGLMFSKGFSEYGVVIGVATVRTNLSYGSGVRKQYTRKGRFEYIWPEFKHVGDVEMKVKELDQSPDLSTNNYGDTKILGYTPYGSELREGYNANTGLFRSRASGNLSYLTYQEQFEDDDYPTIGSDYIEQPSDVVSNTLVTQDGPQFYALFQIIEDSVIPLDPTSDPGLMDHF